MPRVLPLHPRHCDGSERDVQRFLDDGLRLDPSAIDRLSYISHHSYYGCQTKIVICERRPRFKQEQVANANHATALMSACMLRHPRCVRYLLERGADVTVIDAHRMPALFYAVAEASVDCVRLLCENGAAPEHTTVDGSVSNFYLLKAVDRGDAEVLQVLLEHGADINTPGNCHPLSRALRNNHLACVRVLLLNGATFEQIAHPDSTDFRTVPRVRAQESALSVRARAVATMCRLSVNETVMAACVEFGLELREGDRSVFDVLREVATVDPEDLQRAETAAAKQAANRTLSSLARSVVRKALGGECYLKKLPLLYHPTNGRRLVEAPSLRHVLMFEDIL